MSSSKQDVSSDNDQENNCVVCCKPVEIYSVGVCDHPVCFECSTRMRVLCQQNECPICRGQMPQVIFTTELGLFSALYPKLKHSELQDRKYGLIFASPATRRAYQQLLEFRCQICTSNSAKKYGYTGFQQLKDHMRREHGLHYCELCVNNLKIFAFERKCYTKQQLGYHRRKGDPDNTSHRGHPLCEFCDTRFVDSDELLRHLRREHLFCHYCDADGKNQYYSAMEDLRRHFGEEHYLCEEGECKNMPLTAVFRTEIDLKAHVATEHSRFMSKSATKQARTLELEFTLAPRPRPDRNKRVGGGGVGGGGGGGGGPGGSSSRNDEEGAVGYALEAVEEPKQLTAQDFPALGNSSSGTLTLQSRPTSSINFTSKVNPFSREEFPTLGGARTSSNVTITTNSTALRKKPPEVTITRTVRGERPENLAKNKENFPRLGGSSAGTSTVHLSVNNGKITAPKVSIHVNHNSNGAITTTTHITTNAPTSSSSTTNTSSNNNNNNNSRSDVINSQRKIESFPALGNSSSSGSSSSKTSSSNAPVQQPQWVQQKSKKTEQKQSNKVAPPPQLPPSDLSQFPSLSKSASNSNNNGNKSAGESGKKAKKSSSVSVPVMSNNWVANNNNNNNNSSNNNNNKKNKDAGSSSKSGSNDSSKSGSTSSSSNGSSKDKETYLKNADSVDTSKSKNVKKQKKKNPSNNNGTTNNQDTSALSNTQLDVAATTTTDSANNKTNSNTNSNVVDGDVMSNKPSTTTGVDNTKNGLTVKKRSELNIGSLTLTDATTTLGNVEQSAKPPPGFPAKPPPGLTNLSAFPALVKDLTFTNSSGQSYSIQPDSTSSKTYHQPSNFNARNQNLFRRFTDLIDNEQIREFKAYSALFREGRMPAREYYLHCKAVLDAANFDEMFLELLVLLPDIDKQQELYRVYEGALKKNLVVCESCKQVIFKRELSEHYNYHLLENQFPSLTTKDGGSVGEAPSSAWNRRNK